MSDIGQHHYPFLPVHLLSDRFATIDKIADPAPLVIAGESIHRAHRKQSTPLRGEGAQNAS
jgi:hypothetical protein